jgi:thiol-disulfide isomerase/thioredoxin
MRSRPSRSLVLALSALVALAGCGRRVGEIEERDGGAAASVPAQAQASAPSTGGWNAAQIAWQPYEAGLAQAKAQNKPVCLVFSTTWCPHCKNYSHVFEDPRVVAHARDFVMVHLDSDVQEGIASKYAIDGGYIPRTFFLGPDGKVDPTIHAPRPTSRYFYDEHDPSSLLAAMDTARRKLVVSN